MADGDCAGTYSNMSVKDPERGALSQYIYNNNSGTVRPSVALGKTYPDFQYELIFSTLQ